MTRDYKQNEASASSNQYGISWVLGGVAVGLLIGGIAYALMTKPPAPQTVATPGQTSQTGAQITQGSKTPALTTTTTPSLDDTTEEDTRPGFSYHAVLPQLELDVPIPVPQETAPAGTPVETAEVIKQPEVTEAKGRYMFQLGAYRQRAQAQQMQQRAKQNGMNTRVESANINGKTWFRVRLGPTDNLQVVNRWKQRLSSMGINPMMIRL